MLINGSKVRSTDQKVDQHQISDEHIKSKINRSHLRSLDQMFDQQFKCWTNRLNARSADQKFDKQMKS